MRRALCSSDSRRVLVAVFLVSVAGLVSVVVGGVALWGGIGGIWNTVVGVLIVNVINNGMVVIGLPDYLQDGMLGLLVIVAVVLSTDRRSISFVK